MGELVVARQGNQVVGGFYVAPAGNDRLEIGGVYVVPELRKTGLARSLMHYALEHLAYGKPMEAHVLTSNRPAQELFRAAGFEREATNLSYHPRSLTGLEHMPTNDDGQVTADLWVFRSPARHKLAS
jgi:ribosomal protein S18 acetylase RimI-like enzyme